MRIRTLLSCAAVCCAALTARAADPADFIPIPSGPGSVQTLNGTWAFQFVDSSDWSQWKDFMKKTYDYSSWDRIPVPGCWDAAGLEYLRADYAHPRDVNGLYRTTFTVPASWKGQRIIINLDGVLRAYELWINGKRVDSWELANNSCQMDITKFARIGENSLALRVYTRYKGYEFDGNDDWGQAGIHRDIKLFAVPSSHVSDLKVTSTVAKDDSAQVMFAFSLALSGKRSSTVLSGTVKDPKGKTVEEFSYSVDGRTEIEHTWKVGDPSLWTAETPSLYTLEYSLSQSGSAAERLTQKFGIREIRIEGNRLLLNNRLFKLRGVDVHATDPFNGKVISDSFNLKDMELMKRGNINFIRNSHYPREPRFYDLCDSLGFYVMDEVPFGYGDEHLTDPTYQDNLILRADATVVRDKNHPCVIVWSVGNENNLTEICQVTGKHVQKLDPSRPICYPMIGGYFNSLNFDIPEFVDLYAPHYPGVSTLERYAQNTERPFIITEYCHTLGQSLEEHREMWEVMQKNDNLAGGAVWEWVDQGMPDYETKWPGRFAWTDRLWLDENTPIKMEGNQGTDGILYADRTPLPNYYNVRKNYAQAYILTESLTPAPGQGCFRIEIENRYDFVDLRDRVSMSWNITCNGKTYASGTLSPQCPPHGRCTVTIPGEMPKTDGLWVLSVAFTDLTNGYQVNERSWPIMSSEGYGRFLSSLTDGLAQSDAMDMVSEFPLWRAGRKPSLSEDLTIKKANGKYVLGYMMKGDENWKDHWYFRNDEITFEGDIRSEKLACGTEWSYSMAPKGERLLLLESGLGALLDSSITCFQWIGMGPYTEYPGKNSANDFGVFSLNRDDIYFEGSKMGVDALLCTDSRGNGLLFFPSTRNINLEQTDRGVIVTFNSVVSGLGGKSSVTHFPNYSDEISSLDGTVRVVPVSAGGWSKAMGVFANPADVKPFRPFISQYDTYLRAYSDICK